jgi:hypothetical protein
MFLLFFLHKQGIQLLNRWRAKMLSRAAVMTSTLDWIETTIANAYSSNTLPNITAIVQNQLGSIGTILNSIEAKLDALNLTMPNRKQ